MKKLLTFLAFLVLCSPAWAGLYAYYGTITFDHTKVGNAAENETNYPAVVALTGTSFKSVANGGQIVNGVSFNSQTVPADLIFTSDSSGLNLLTWDVFAWDSSTSGAVYATVMIPTLSYTADTVIYVFYGAASKTAWQGGTLGTVFDSNMQAVYHFSGGTAYDYTSHANNATVNTGTSYASPTGGGVAFDGSTQYISIPSSATINFTSSNNFTLSYLYRFPSTPGANNYNLLGTSSGAANGYRVVTWSASRTLGDGFNSGWTYQGSTCGATTWCHETFTAGSSNVNTYHSGAYNNNGYNPGVVAASNPLLFAVDQAMALYLAIDIGEVRISKVTRSDGWIKTDYYNEINPVTFSVVSGVGVCSGTCGGASATKVVRRVIQ